MPAEAVADFEGSVQGLPLARGKKGRCCGRLLLVVEVEALPSGYWREDSRRRCVVVCPVCGARYWAWYD